MACITRSQVIECKHARTWAHTGKDKTPHSSSFQLPGPPRDAHELPMTSSENIEPKLEPMSWPVRHKFYETILCIHWTTCQMIHSAGTLTPTCCVHSMGLVRCGSYE
eukprot:COSAG01_NODE_1183_length_11346_cov_263.800302_12_plen_107_part_00